METTTMGYIGYRIWGIWDLIMGLWLRVWVSKFQRSGLQQTPGPAVGHGA